MTGNLISLAAEALVAVLLVITIGYCVLLNSRLKRLRADESDLRATITELVSATEIAERAISSLKVAAVDCDKTLATRIREAEYFSIEIAREIDEGQKVLDRIKQIAGAVRRSDAQIEAEEQHAAKVAEAMAPAVPEPAMAMVNTATIQVRGVVSTASETIKIQPSVVAVPKDDVRTAIQPSQSKSGSRIDELKAMAEQARERLKEMRRVNAEKAA